MNNTEYRFHLPDMSCGHCVASIGKALQPLGVQTAADVPSKQLRVQAPAAVSREQIAQRLREAGYPPAGD